jgi:ankyrin repeat protein
MNKAQRPPYATAIEVIRVVANALNTKFSHKTLDDMALKADVDFRLIDRLIEQSICEPIAQNSEGSIADFFAQSAKDSIKSYLAVVSKISLDGVSWEQGIPILLRTVFPQYAANFLFKVQKTFGGPNPVFLVDSNERSVKVALEWIAEHEGGWGQFVKGLTKEQKDRISAWKRGDDLPTVQFIGFLQTWSQGPWPEFINWPRVRALMLLARALDWARSKEVGDQFFSAIREAVWSPENKTEFPEVARRLQKQANQNFESAHNYIEQIQHGLMRTTPKKFSDKEKLIQSIRKARKILSRLDRNATTDCWLDWHEGRWNVLAGKLERACEFYKKAFEGSLYRSGENQREVIEEGLVVAASMPRPDKVFLKRLKNMAITFGYDIPSVSSDAMSGKNSASDFIEDWEVNLWRAHFKGVFPGTGMFSGTKYPETEPRKGPLIITDIDAIKPDYRHPNRKIKVGETWQKTYPQVVWFAEIEKTDIVEKLIEKGADVNTFSDSNDSPILMALEAVNAFSPTSSMDESLLKVLLNHDHKPETLNKLTSKKRLLPLISAVESGRVDVVQKILDMGADPNLRGKTDEQTPLNVCLKCIAIVKNPDRLGQMLNKEPITPEFLDSVRRHSGGLAGFSLEDQRHYLESTKSHHLYGQIIPGIMKFVVDKVLSNAPLESLRNIALTLLKSGADPNAEHSFPVPGYTPLMLAAELDELELFEAMLH